MLWVSKEHQKNLQWRVSTKVIQHPNRRVGAGPLWCWRHDAFHDEEAHDGPVNHAVKKRSKFPSITSLKENSELGELQIWTQGWPKKIDSNSDLFDESTDFKTDHLMTGHEAARHRQGTDVRVLGKAKSPNPCFEYNLANSVNLSVEFSTLPPSPFLYQIHGWLRCICYEHTEHTSELPNIQ